MTHQFLRFTLVNVKTQLPNANVMHSTIGSTCSTSLPHKCLHCGVHGGVHLIPSRLEFPFPFILSFGALLLSNASNTWPAAAAASSLLMAVLATQTPQTQTACGPQSHLHASFLDIAQSRSHITSAI